MMTESAAKAMNMLRIDEAYALYTEGKIVVIGNGQVCAIVSEEKAQEEEDRRCANGY